MTAPLHFDQKGQYSNTQTNIDHADQVIIQPSTPALPVPQQLPSSPKDFTGREDEIAGLLDQFGRGATITGLRGMGGVGKTALALVLADRLKDHFPDGQLFLKMQGTSKTPLKPEEAMAHIIHSYLGLDVKLPTDQNGLSGLYRSVLSGKRALILLDNAADRAQVELLIPSVASALLITSRNKFALAGLKELDLDVLPRDDAKDLLLSICGRIGERAGELAELCGCLPLALRNAAYALKERPNMGVASYIKRLADARKRLELVEASFTLSYQLLTPEMQKLWSLLSVFPADFDLAAAAAVWKMENDATEDALGELVKWSLVDFLPSAAGEGGRFKLHDLARDFADSRLDCKDLNQAQQHHSEHYHNVLSIANQIFMQGKVNSLAGLILFDLEKMNILAGQSWAERNMDTNAFAIGLCKTFPSCGAYVLNLRLLPKERIPWLEAGLQASRISKDKTMEGIHLGNLGNAYSDLSEPRKAIEYYELALKISREIGDMRGEGKRLGNLGNAYSHLGDSRKSIEYYELALKISREIGDMRSEGYSQGNLGNAYSHLGDSRKAIEYYELALKISREIGDRRGEEADLGNLGLAYTHLGDSRKAIEYYELALKISREIGDRRSEGNSQGNLGLAYSHLGKPRKAIEYCELALKIAREIGDMRGEGNRLGNIGNAYSDMGEPQKAIEYYDQALKIARKIGDMRGEGNRLGNIGNSYSDMGEPQKAIEYYDQALKIARKIGDMRGEGTHLFNMSHSLNYLGHRDRAISLAESALAIFEQIESPHAETVRKALAEWKS